MYRSRPAVYKIRGIDAKRENTSMFSDRKIRGREKTRGAVNEGWGMSEYQIKVVHIDPRYACSWKIGDRRTKGGINGNTKVRNYAPSTLTWGGSGLAISSTAFNTLVDQSSSSSSSSKCAMLNLLGHLSPDGTC